jgi:hypothetical protein
MSHDIRRVAGWSALVFAIVFAAVWHTPAAGEQAGPVAPAAGQGRAGAPQRGGGPGGQPPSGIPPQTARGVYPATSPDDDAGFVAIFDGTSLAGWDGDTTFWRVENGEIVGETTPDTIAKTNSFLIWRGGHVVLSRRGQVTRAAEGPVLKTLASIGDPTLLRGVVNTNGWNQYHIIARGAVLMHIINGQLMSVAIDEDARNAVSEGLLGFQMHTGPPFKVQFRNIRLRTLS